MAKKIKLDKEITLEKETNRKRRVPPRLNTPHDLLLKATLSSPKAIQDFFKTHLQPDIRDRTDLASIAPAKSEYVSATLRKSLNDLVFTCKIDGNLAFLVIEHQSSPDWNMHVRFLAYNVELLKQYMKGKPPRTPLPYMHNICVSHGKLNKPYPYSTNFCDYFPDSELAKQLGLFVNFDLHHVSCVPDDVLESRGTVSLVEKLFKYQEDESFFDELDKELERCKEWILGTPTYPAPLGVDYWQSIFYYSLSVLDPALVSEEKLINLFIEKLDINKEEIMTIAYQIEKRGEKRGEIRGEIRGEQKGIKKGIQEGMQKGIEQEKSKIAISMLKRGADLNFIQEVTGLSKEAIEQLRKG